MFKKLKIKTRLILSFVIVLVLTSFVLALSIGTLQSQDKNFKRYSKDAVTSVMAAKDCRANTLWIATDIRNLVLETDIAEKRALEKKIWASIDVLNSSFTLLESSYTGDTGILKQYRENIDAWLTVAKQILAANANGEEELSKELVLTQCSLHLAENLETSNIINDNLEQLRSEQEQYQYSTSSSAMILLCIIFALEIALIVLLSFVLTNSIVNPIDEMDHAAIEMKKGDLNTPISYHSKDAVGRLADSLRGTMSVLSLYVKDIARVMGEMAEGNFNLQPTQSFIGDFKPIEESITRFLQKMSVMLRTILDSANIVNVAAEQVSNSAQSLAEGSIEQAASIQELSASISEISVQVGLNADNAQNANLLGKNVAKEIEDSDLKMGILVDAMTDITNSSNEIGKIIKTIDDIAFQTNILALNAAVEAARAGAAGKGFAVVADEVRNLASKSAEAAKSTTELIESSVRAVENGTKVANETAKALERVVDGANQMTELIEKISTASADQASSTTQIMQSVEEISIVVQRNSVSAEECAAASEELSSQAQVLTTLVKKFELIDKSNGYMNN